MDLYCCVTRGGDHWIIYSYLPRVSATLFVKIIYYFLVVLMDGLGILGFVVIK